jgi:hypothetical protein
MAPPGNDDRLTRRRRRFLTDVAVGAGEGRDRALAHHHGTPVAGFDLAACGTEAA